MLMHVCLCVWPAVFVQLLNDVVDVFLSSIDYLADSKMHNDNKVKLGNAWRTAVTS